MKCTRTQNKITLINEMLNTIMTTSLVQRLKIKFLWICYVPRPLQCLPFKRFQVVGSCPADDCNPVWSFPVRTQFAVVGVFGVRKHLPQNQVSNHDCPFSYPLLEALSQLLLVGCLIWLAPALFALLSYRDARRSFLCFSHGCRPQSLWSAIRSPTGSQLPFHMPKRRGFPSGPPWGCPIGP